MAAHAFGGDVIERYVPVHAPRTLVRAGRSEAFRAYCTTGAGAAAFARIKEDFDRDYLALPFPDEPVTYGDPSPSARDSVKADRWREVQDVTGRVGGVAEAATLCWVVTGEEKYLAKAREFLVAACRWHLDPDWRSGPVVGATDIYYNDEGHFRLWRKLPLVYDQIRDHLTADEKALVLAHFRARGARSVAWIKRSGIEKVQRNSIASEASSHPVRFMAMTGLAGLALWDDLPEAREWWAFAYTFYRDQFTPWGGDDGGWAEGVAYWRGTIEHAFFQDALLVIGDPSAYASAFWKNSAYFQVYNVQPYLATSFGDLSNAGKFNLEPATAEYLLHLARVQQDGFLRSYAELCTDSRPRPAELGLAGLDRRYPTSAEFLVRNFTAADRPLPAAQPLSDLPPQRWFRDVGWVSLHSALGRPADDIQVTFVSSPYGSFSHSHAHQNAFVLNAYGESLAIASGVREFHNSPHHEAWTRQTRSKNAILIDGKGQRPKDKYAVGKITRWETTPRATWTTGDATAAYQRLQPPGRVVKVTRDLVFIDQRYVVLRDHVLLKTPGKLSWLLHADRHLTWDDATATAFIRNGRATLTTRLLAPYAWKTQIADEFTVPFDPKYKNGAQINYQSTAEWNDHQLHLTAESVEAAAEHVVFAVLWPEREGSAPAAIDVTREGDTITVKRPDGTTDTLTLSDDAMNLR